MIANLGGLVINSLSDFLQWFYTLLNIPDMPDWMMEAFNTLGSVLVSATSLVSWVFPNEYVWQQYLGFVVLCETICFSSHLLFWLLDMYERLKH